MIEQDEDKKKDPNLADNSAEQAASESTQQSQQESQQTPDATVPKQRMSSAEMLAEVNNEIARLKAEGESDEEALKRRRRDERWAAIGDGIAAIANLVGTARGAKNSYEGTPLSDRVRARYDKIKADRDANRQNYLGMAMNRYKILKGDEDAATSAAQHAEKMGLKREELGIKRQVEENKAKRQEAADKAAADRAAEAKNNNDRNYILNKKRLDEQKRHNGAMEGISASREAREASREARLDKAGTEKNKKDEMTIRLRDGSVHIYSKDKVGAINSLAEKMAVKAREAADIYTKREDSANSTHFRALARALEKAKSKDEIHALVIKNIAAFPSLDGEIRRIIGATQHQNSNVKPAQNKKITGVNWNAN